jgi:hypothetical protein
MAQLNSYQQERLDQAKQALAASLADEGNLRQAPGRGRG